MKRNSNYVIQQKKSTWRCLKIDSLKFLLCCGTTHIHCTRACRLEKPVSFHRVNDKPVLNDDGATCRPCSKPGSENAVCASPKSSFMRILLGFASLHTGFFTFQPIRHQFEGHPLAILLAEKYFLLCVPLKNKFDNNMLLGCVAARPILSNIIKDSNKDSENVCTDPVSHPTSNYPAKPVVCIKARRLCLRARPARNVVK